MKLVIDVDDNNYELLNKAGIEIDWNLAFHGKEKDREMTFAIFDLVEALKNGTPYEERPHGEWIMNKTSVRGRNYTCTACEKVSRNKFHFCPNCGADMRGE